MKNVAQAKQEGRASPNGRFLRVNDVVATIGLSRATIYRMIANGTFPRQVRLTQQCAGWWQHDVDCWVQSRLAECPHSP